MLYKLVTSPFTFHRFPDLAKNTSNYSRICWTTIFKFKARFCLHQYRYKVTNLFHWRTYCFICSNTITSLLRQTLLNARTAILLANAVPSSTARQGTASIAAQLAWRFFNSTVGAILVSDYNLPSASLAVLILNSWHFYSSAIWAGIVTTPSSACCSGLSLRTVVSLLTRTKAAAVSC